MGLHSTVCAAGDGIGGEVWSVLKQWNNPNITFRYLWVIERTTKENYDVPITYPSMRNDLVAFRNPDYNFESLMSHKSLQAHYFLLCD